MKTVHVIISGHVQGVWYRGWTVELAKHLKISGWVRNRHDGTVEATLSGNDASIDTMIVEMHDGPPHAVVSSIKTATQEYKQFNDFQQLFSK